MPLTEEFRPPSLEQELAKLRAQIALIIAGKEGVCRNFLFSLVCTLDVEPNLIASAF